ncbi:MAG: endo-1,4-beta-xylanase [Lachnospiraceae bacterium]|nr:endo-1,4-beta-xylanase [Lachnospiraceae bacterium]
MSKKTMAFVMAALLFFGSFVMFLPINVKAAPTEKTYTFSDLKSTMEYGLTSSIDGNGVLEINFEDQYKSQFYAIPSDIDPDTITKVVFDVTSGNAADLAFKLHTQSDYDSDNKGGTPVSYGSPQIIPDTKGCKYFSIMSLNTGSTKAKIASVTFTVSGEGNPSGSDSEPDAGPSVEGENLLQNGNFADADVSMWGAELEGSAKITTGVSDTPIFGDVTTYGIISDRQRPYDCFGYDVTSLVENGQTYAYCFYVMLSDEYEGAPATQRQVDFAPYVTTDGNTSYLGSYSAEVQGSSSQQLTPGEWTKFEGTFKVAASGNLDKVVLRFLEQGENYGEGACVKGTYYLTGASFISLNLETKKIEQGIPNLKDALTADFGDDMICGTSLSGSEINDKVLMELVQKHFNAVTLGNELKPDSHLGNSIRGTEKATINGQTIDVPVLDYSNAERYLDYFLAWNEEHPESPFKIRGHVLVWHSQTPEWFFHEDYDASKPYVAPEVMTLRQEWYIKSVLEHYVGQNSKYKDLFYGWDVVNEAVSDGTGTYRNDSEGSSWWAVYKSNEFIVNAFIFANKYAPADVELYYNDYNDCTPDKVNGIVKLLNDVLAVEGTRIDAMGMQGHYDSTYPTTDQFIDAAAKYGEVVGKIMLTEVDFKSSSAYDGTEATLKGEYVRQAYRYKAVYDAMKEVDSKGIAEVGGFIVWGVIDGNSWLQAYTGVGGGVTDGSPQCPLLFDDDMKAKPAFWALVDPTKLEPETKSVAIMQAMPDDFSLAPEYTFTGENTGVSFQTIWNEGQVQFKVTVTDADQDETDGVKVYLDKYNSKTSGIKNKMVEGKRSDVPSTDDGKYTLILNVPVDTAEANAVVGFDIVVTNKDKTIVFNDTTMAQETSSQYYAEGRLKAFLFIPKGSATVDGELDDSWNNAVTVVLGNKTDNPVAKANVKLLWDEEYLYAYAEVTDPVLNKDSGEVHEQDSFEIFIDETNSKASAYNDATKQYRINYENEHSFNGDKCVEENETTFVKVTDTGYIVEGAFKWTEITPAEGNYIGIELQINDADENGVRIGTVTWNDITNQCWSNPGCFGTGMLVAASGAAPAADGSADTTDGKSKSKVGLIVGICAAAVLAGTAAFVSLKKKPEDEAKDAESEKEDFDKGDIKEETSEEKASEEKSDEGETEAEAKEEAKEDAEAEAKEEAKEDAEEEVKEETEADSEEEAEDENKEEDK